MMLVRRYPDNRFSYRATQTNLDRRRLLLVTAIVVIVFAADSISGGYVRGFLRNVTGAMWSATVRAEERITANGFFSSRAQFAAENTALHAQILQYQGKLAAADVTAAENEQLRSLTHLAVGAPGISVPIISSFRTSPYGTFLIGAGSADGIEKDALVQSSDGYVIGKVSDVSSHTALVDQLFAPRRSVETLISAIPVTLTGVGGGNAIGRAPRGAKISEGDIVSAPSMGGKPIGVVGTVTSDAADAFSAVEVRAPANLTTLRFVYVITSK
jgi:cell shape-determining protein MreC